MSEKYSILHVLVKILSISTGLTPFSGVAHFGLACHQYLLLPIYFASQPTQNNIVVYMPSPSGPWSGSMAHMTLEALGDLPQWIFP